jgi:hypothetical protein
MRRVMAKLPIRFFLIADHSRHAGHPGQGGGSPGLGSLRGLVSLTRRAKLGWSDESLNGGPARRRLAKDRPFMRATLDQIVASDRYALSDPAFRDRCRATLAEDGVLVLPEFLTPDAIESIRREGAENEHRAYYCRQSHNVYLTPPDPDFPADHPRNRGVLSSKGCIADDSIPTDSPLRALYESPEFRDYLCTVLGEKALYEYADPLSSINLHYANPGQELGWHFDNSSFAITLMIQEPESGGGFEYVKGMRDADKGELNFPGVSQVLDGEIAPKRLSMRAGALVLFRGRNAIHRVAPVEGNRTRMLVVLAYNSKPGISLSESARMTFYGRLA